LVLVTACSWREGGDDARKAKSVILLVGDGMGPLHRDAVRLHEVGVEGKLAMDRPRYAGLSRTNSADPGDYVTDSAAAATAMASGTKTKNFSVGMDADGEHLPTILEQAKEAGKATGLVTTDEVTAATPAAFAAHVPDRDEQSEIARQYIEVSKPDVILGGGEDYWYPEGDPGAYPNRPSEKSEGKGQLAKEAQRSGYDYIADPDELEGAEGPKILGLFANGQMFDKGPVGEGVYDPVISLPEMAKKAIRTLSEDNEGFFLLVEEEAMDEMSHEHNAELMLEAGKQFDEAVEVALTYAEEHPDTLVITTADHETGGLVVEGPSSLGRDRPDMQGPFRVANADDRWFSVHWTTEAHTPAAVPVTAGGPGAEDLSGTYEITHLYDVMARVLLNKSPGGDGG
jgi:alkaline phosphatase